MTLYTSLFIRNTDSINTAMRHSNKAEQKKIRRVSRRHCALYKLNLLIKIYFKSIKNCVTLLTP